jgi:ketosteroid isomerase-like protein
MDEHLIQLEHEGWEALATSQVAARSYWSHLLADDAVMLFPGGVRLDGKQAILESIAVQPWKSFELADVRLHELGAGVGACIYRVTAQREGAPAYSALVSSTYCRQDDGWRLAIHQQTPV